MKILIVDDEPEALADIASYIEKYEQSSYVLCHNAPEALIQLKLHNFDIALLDIEMPFMNGLELAEHLLTQSPGIKIAFITAYNHYATEAFEVNAIDYILKPVREDRLFKTLDKIKEEQGNLLKNATTAVFTIQMFVKFVVRIDGEPYKWNRMKSAELFAYLLENQALPIHKEKLCDLLWPDKEPKKALINLQTAVYAIRQLLEHAKINLISIQYADNCYTLYTKVILTDVDQFENLLLKGKEQPETSLFDQAVELYKGEYLDEDGWLWAEPRKENLRRKYVEVRKKLKQYNR